MENVLDQTFSDLRWESGHRHDRLSMILETEPELKDYYIFGVVRNPWARLVSWWSNVQDFHGRAKEGHKGAIRKFEKYPAWAQIVTYADFDTFIMKGPDDLARLGTPQINWLETPARRADYIGRTESLDKDIPAILSHLGVEEPVELPHKNKSKHGSYRDYYTPAGRDRVAELYARDIEEFGYTF